MTCYDTPDTMLKIGARNNASKNAAHLTYETDIKRREVLHALLHSK